MKDQWNGATHTKRCTNRREKIIAQLSQCQGHCEYPRIADFTHRVLNLAAARSAMGQEDSAKALQHALLRALKKIARGSLHRALASGDLQLEDAR